MDLRGRYLFWVDMLMFVLGFGLAFLGVVAWSAHAENDSPRGDAGMSFAQAVAPSQEAADPESPGNAEMDRVWEDRIERSEPQVRDLSISSAVETGLKLTPEVAGYPVTATTRQRVVTLTGRVPSSTTAAEAIGVAEKTPGVEKVIDKLKIDPAVKPDRDRGDQPQADATGVRNRSRLSPHSASPPRGEQSQERGAR